MPWSKRTIVGHHGRSQTELLAAQTSDSQDRLPVIGKLITRLTGKFGQFWAAFTIRCSFFTNIVVALLKMICMVGAFFITGIEQGF